MYQENLKHEYSNFLFGPRYSTGNQCPFQETSFTTEPCLPSPISLCVTFRSKSSCFVFRQKQQTDKAFFALHTCDNHRNTLEYTSESFGY
jgi:hypothetical protein